MEQKHMSGPERTSIKGTAEAWETRALGNDAAHAKRAPAELEQQIDEALGLQAISIRLPKSTAVRFHPDAHRCGLYGIQPIGSRQFRGPSIAEVVHFQTCHAVGAYSAVNAQVPPWVPVWQYIDPEERAAAARKCAAIAKTSGAAA